MKPFLDENFLLTNDTAIRLFHEFAKHMPIIDYHNHLPPQEMADDKSFENITRIWLNGDHYKWRAMRINGIPEDYITGGASDRDKFRKWAETVPYTMRNPLYHWTHLELQRYFGITEVLNASNADRIYDQTTEMLQSGEFRVRRLLERMDVRVLCTTDDPVDSLEHHQRIHADGWRIKVLPAFRPDKAMNVDDPLTFNAYLDLLEKSADVTITTFDDYLDALRRRHDYFVANGCKVSDHGMEQIYAEDYTDAEIRNIFDRIRAGHALTVSDNRKFKSAMLLTFAEWDWERGFVQQYHLGALRNNNTRMLRKLGPDTGWDSIGDFEQGRSLVRFLDRLDGQDKLAKTILYNLNPADNELMATMIGNYNDGSSVGKVQWGSGWWFLDQKDGMTRQMNALSNMGLISRFVGMLTDSRSFLSFPRHEYFRRILCNIFGEEIENGELPNDITWVGSMMQDICYRNARDYFGWQDADQTVENK
jgi:glucuronate isomerase